jgi:hypothetical protein
MSRLCSPAEALRRRGIITENTMTQHLIEIIFYLSPRLCASARESEFFIFILTTYAYRAQPVMKMYKRKRSPFFGSINSLSLSLLRKRE